MPDNKVTKAIVCPMCGELSKAEIYTSVNHTVNKRIRNKVVDGELFAWVCPSCKHTARLTYPILYNDMKNRLSKQLKLAEAKITKLENKIKELKSSNVAN